MNIKHETKCQLHRTKCKLNVLLDKLLVVSKVQNDMLIQIAKLLWKFIDGDNSSNTDRLY